MSWFRKPPVKRLLPQGFCTKCGKPMLDSYTVSDFRYSPTTGRKQELRVYGRVCSSRAGRYDDAFYSHDGVSANNGNTPAARWEDK